MGVTKLIGDAFREESLARRAVDTSASAKGADAFDKLTLIGIVSTSDLKNQESLIGTDVITN